MSKQRAPRVKGESSSVPNRPLCSRPENDLTYCFPLIVEAMSGLRPYTSAAT